MIIGVEVVFFIVYLFHSYEFTRKISADKYETFFFIISYLHSFYISDIKRRYELNLMFLKFMLSFKTIDSLNSREYVNYLEQKERGKY